MSKRPFDRDVLRPLEGPKSVDFNRLAAEGANAGLMHLLRSVGGPQSSLTNTDADADFFGFYGAGFLVVPTSPASTNVRILAGLGAKRDALDQPSAIGGVDGLDEINDVKPVVLRTDIPTVAVPAPPASPDQRIDIIEVAVRRDLYDTTATNFLQLPSATRVPLPVTKTLSYAVDPAQVPITYVTDPAPSTSPISYKIGQPGNPPTAPATTAGYVKIAEILVDNVVSNPAGTIRQVHIADYRRLLFLGGSATFSLTASFPLAAGTAPTVLNAAVPPGVRLAVSRLAGATPQFEVYVLNNLRDAVLTAHSPKQGAYPTTTFQSVRGEQSSLAAIDATSQTAIGAATRTAPAQEVPIGQPARKLFGVVTNWNGTTFVDSADAVLYFNISGVLT